MRIRVKHTGSPDQTLFGFQDLVPPETAIGRKPVRSQQQVSICCWWARVLSDAPDFDAPTRMFLRRLLDKRGPPPAIAASARDRSSGDAVVRPSTTDPGSAADHKCHWGVFGRRTPGGGSAGFLWLADYPRRRLPKDRPETGSERFVLSDGQPA
jgi:hypothetical protein